METKNNLEKAFEQAKEKAIEQLTIINDELFAYDYNARTWNIADTVNVAVKDCGAIHTVFLGVSKPGVLPPPSVEKTKFFLIGMEEN